MSSIEKLSIRGVRSFSPSREEVIEFYHPLTVILGDNGCGKTTVIECLKLATTGALPPGARSGQSLIHDPKIAGTSEVKASIRLRFRNQAGKLMVAQRTFQLQQTKSALKFKALDGVIRVVNDLGEKVSMNHKCSELDKHIPDMLGVARPILESVIFCHQEESNWPLLEGAELKKRFDGIFEATRYTKALEAIRKLKKARNDDTKDFKRDLEVLTAHMKQAQSVRDKIEATTASIDEVESEMDAREARVGELQQKHEETSQLLKSIEDAYGELRDKGRDIKAKEETVKAAYNRIEELMSDPYDELVQLLNNCKGFQVEHRQSLALLETKAQERHHAKDNASKEHSDMNALRGKFVADLSRLEKDTQELLALAAQYGSAHKFYHQALSFEDSDISTYMSAFKTAIAKQKQALKERDTANAAREKTLVADVSDQRSRLHHAKETIEDSNKALGDLADTRRKVSHEVKQLSSSGLPSDDCMRELDQAIEDAKKRVESFRSHNDLATLQSEIDTISRTLHEREYDLTQLKDKAAILRSYDQQQMALQAKRDDYREKKRLHDSDVSEKLMELQETLGSTIISSDNAPLSTVVENVEELCRSQKDLFSQLSRELRSDEQALQNSNAALNTSEKSLAKLRHDVANLERGEIGQLRQLIQEVAPGEDIANAENILQVAEKQYLDAKDKTLRCKNTVTFLSIFKQKGERDQCCPLCQRGMSPREVENFIRIVDEKTDDTKMTDKIRRSEAKEVAAQQKWKNMGKLMPSWRKWLRVSGETPEVERELTELQIAKTSLQESVDDVTARHQIAQRRYDEAVSAQQQLSVFQKAEVSLAHTDNRISSDEKQLRDQIRDRTGSEDAQYSEIQEKVDIVDKTVLRLRHQCDSKKTEHLNLEKQLQGLGDEVRRKESEKIDLSNKHVRYQAALRDQEKLRNDEKKLRGKIADLEVSVPVIERELEKVSTRYEDAKSRGKQELDKLREEQKLIEADFGTFNTALSKIRAVQKENLDESLAQLDQRLLQHKERQAEIEKELAELTPEIDRTKKLLVKQESVKSQILANLEYRDLQEAVKEMLVDEEQIKAKIRALPDRDSVEDSVSAAKSAIEAETHKLSLLRGRGEQLSVQLRGYKAELRQENLADVEEKYRLKLIQYETTAMAVADLDRFYKALDESLLEYHSKKIEEINTIIRQLWQITYKGQDIDTIELVSGQQGETASRATRSYDYRVVMRKAGAMIDMRGRCSAGQKVLAALVIRLALAETFCLNCGILALDEPTTNLDTENKYGLAQAITEYVCLVFDTLREKKSGIANVSWLRSIINARSKQENFQLVCITHDEEFVQMLSQTQSLGGSRPEYYWRISREDM